MKKILIGLALASLLGLSGQAFAIIGTIDDVPSATLLLPYFEVDSTNQNGQNTLFSINNASATAILAHVAVWSDQSVPVLDFDVYLTGYDVQTINLYDVLVNGNLPRTASAGQDSGDKISPKGPVSQDINFASCSGILPYTNPAVSASFRAHLLAALQGNASPATGQCYGSKKKDGILRGYVTVDTVNACGVFFPSDGAQYLTFLTNQNVLWGDYFYINEAQNFADGETLVGMEACTTTLATCFPLGHTFYGRYNLGNMLDAREALPTTMAGRYINGGTFSGGTDYIIWREGNSAAAPYPCNLNGPASWYPLGSTQIAIFDETEQPVTTATCPSGDPTCTTTILIPNEAQRVNVATDLLAPFNFGWTYLNLQHSGLGPAYADNFAQMWLEVRMEANGRFSVGMNGIQFDNANTPVTTIIPIP
jgi:hypothetical protein